MPGRRRKKKVTSKSKLRASAAASASSDGAAPAGGLGGLDLSIGKVTELGDHDNHYYVEEILGFKIDNGVQKYWIKWRDWDSKYNTWEVAQNLDDCPGLRDQFLENHPEAKATKEAFEKAMAEAPARGRKRPTAVKNVGMVSEAQGPPVLEPKGSTRPVKTARMHTGRPHERGREPPKLTPMRSLDPEPEAGHIEPPKLISETAGDAGGTATTDVEAWIGTTGAMAGIPTTGVEAWIGTTGAMAGIPTTGVEAWFATTGLMAGIATTDVGAEAIAEIATTGIGAGAMAGIVTTGVGTGIAATGVGAEIATTGVGAEIATTGVGAEIATTGVGAGIATTGVGAEIATTGVGAGIATTGVGAGTAPGRSGFLIHGTKLTHLITKEMIEGFASKVPFQIFKRDTEYLPPGNELGENVVIVVKWNPEDKFIRPVLESVAKIYFPEKLNEFLAEEKRKLELATNNLDTMSVSSG